jgi:hypothetical protein
MSEQIYELIPQIMSEVGSIEKGKKNAQQGYKFRGIDDVFSAFQPLLAKHKVFYIPEVLASTTTDRESKAGNLMVYTNLQVAYTFYASDGSHVRAVVVGEASDSADKSSNKAMSAALKYALLQIFCVPTESMDDADAHTPELARKQVAAVKPVPMSERDKALATVKELLETVTKEEAMAQMSTFGVGRVSDMDDNQLSQFKVGLELAIKSGKVKGGA